MQIVEPPKKYDIKDAARYLGVAPSTLRYWESEGLVRADRNRDNEYRQYSLHGLIDASEIAFYRKLGVSVKELKYYHELTVEALDEALGRTEQGVRERMAELVAVQERLARQRELNACAERLAENGMQPGYPEAYRFITIDYDDPEDWIAFVHEPWRYGLVISAECPEEVHDAIIHSSPVDVDSNSNRDNRTEARLDDDRRGDCPDVVWSVEDLTPTTLSFECLLRVDPYTNASNVVPLLTEARTRFMEPRMIIGAYLLTAAVETGGHRLDYYRAWVIGDAVS